MKKISNSSVDSTEKSGLQLLDEATHLTILHAFEPLAFFSEFKKPNQYLIKNNVGEIIFYAVFSKQLNKKFYKFLGHCIMILVDTDGNKILSLHKRYKYNLCCCEKIINIGSYSGLLLASIRKEVEDGFTYRILNSKNEIIFYFYMGRCGREHKLTKPDGITEIGKMSFSFPPACSHVVYKMKTDITNKAILLGISILVMNENVSALSDIQLE